MRNEAREFALTHGAGVMLYPTTEPPFEQRFMDCPEITASQIINRQRIIGLTAIFGVKNWPRMG